MRITVVQMPAVNTPQFSWVLSRLPRHPQPVPPIYQPEVAAQGVVFAADHPDRKEHWVGASTAATIMAQKFAAPVLDRYLARTGYDSQQTDERADPGTAEQPVAAGRPAAGQRPGRARRSSTTGPARTAGTSPSPRRSKRRARPSRRGVDALRDTVKRNRARPAGGRRSRRPATRVRRRDRPRRCPRRPARDFPAVDGVTATVYEIPTDRPEADGTLAWSTTTLVVAHVSGGGRTGLGYTYASGACKPLIEGELAAAVAGHGVLDTGAAWQAMVRAVRNLGRPGLVSYAISAVDTALWDLKATLLGLPVSRLLGAVRDEVPVYGSGGFTTYDEPAARAQLERWTGDLGIPRVKIKIGESWGTAARPGPGQDRLRPAGDRPGRRAVRRRQRRLHAASRRSGWPTPWPTHDVTWFEEPVSSDDLDGLREVRDQVDPDVTAGEYGYDLPYFARMVDAQAVDCLQVDVTRCGGITEWLRAAAVAAARGLQVSGHCAPNLHAHVAAAVPNLRHLEYFHDHARIESMLFDGALDPTGGVLRPDPGGRASA